MDCVKEEKDKTSETSPLLDQKMFNTSTEEASSMSEILPLLDPYSSSAIDISPAKEERHVEKELDLGEEEPDLGYKEPDLGNEELDLCNEEPDLGNEEPDLGNKEPVLGNEEPDLGNEEPLAIENQDLAEQEVHDVMMLQYEEERQHNKIQEYRYENNQEEMEQVIGKQRVELAHDREEEEELVPVENVEGLKKLDSVSQGEVEELKLDVKEQESLMLQDFAIEQHESAAADPKKSVGEFVIDMEELRESVLGLEERVEPEMGYEKAAMSYEEHEEPAVVCEDPVVSHDKLPAVRYRYEKHDDPGVSYDEHGEPAMSYEEYLELGVSYDEHQEPDLELGVSCEEHEPGRSYEEHKKTAISFEEPAEYYEEHEPVRSYEEHEEAAMSYEEHEEPAMSYEEPAMSYEEPAVISEDPAVSYGGHNEPAMFEMYGESAAEIKEQERLATELEITGLVVDLVLNGRYGVDDEQNEAQTVDEQQNVLQTEDNGQNEEQAVEEEQNAQQTLYMRQNKEQAVEEEQNVQQAVEEGQNVQQAVVEEQNVQQAVVEEQNVQQAVEEGQNKEKALDMGQNEEQAVCMAQDEEQALDVATDLLEHSILSAVCYTTQVETGTGPDLLQTTGNTPSQGEITGTVSDSLPEQIDPSPKAGVQSKLCVKMTDGQQSVSGARKKTPSKSVEPAKRVDGVPANKSERREKNKQVMSETITKALNISAPEFTPRRVPVLVSVHCPF
jgi:hypothetical protein